MTIFRRRITVFIVFTISFIILFSTISYFYYIGGIYHKTKIDLIKDIGMLFSIIGGVFFGDFVGTVVRKNEDKGYSAIALVTIIIWNAVLISPFVLYFFNNNKSGISIKIFEDHLELLKNPLSLFILSTLMVYYFKPGSSIDVADKK